MTYSPVVLCTALLCFLCACSERVERRSVKTSAESRYSSEVQQITLRPGRTAISVPSNELWAVHTDPVSRGWPQNEPYVGKAWDHADVRFVLFPEIRERTPETEATFNEPEGRRLLRITLMQPMGFDGDVRKAWKIVRLEPIDGASPAAWAAAKAAGAYPAPLVAKHPDLDLDEYEGKDEFGSRFFRSDGYIIRCWQPPLSYIQHVCESSFNLNNGLLVNVEFPYESLSRWKELLAFSKQKAVSYAAPRSAAYAH